MDSLWDGIIIGGVGGFAASLMFSLSRFLTNQLSNYRDNRKIERWLKNNTTNKEGNKFRSTRAISSYNNLSEDRVRALCYVNPKITLSTGEREDLWSIYGRDSLVEPKIRQL